MPEIICKITNDDGTELSFGPMGVSKVLAGKVADLLADSEAKRVKERESERRTDLEQQIAEREKANVKAERERVLKAHGGKLPEHLVGGES